MTRGRGRICASFCLVHAVGMLSVFEIADGNLWNALILVVLSAAGHYALLRRIREVRR